MDFEIIDVSGLLHKVSTINGGHKMPSATARPTLVENITVFQVGKFGVRVDEKTWMNVNEPLTPSHFEANKGYKVSVSVAKTGRKYINEILGIEESTAAPAAAPAPVATAPVATAAAPAVKAADVKTSDRPVRAGYGQQLTEYDLAIQRQISRAGVYQAALNSPALAQWCTNIEEYLSLVRKAADAGMKYVNE